MNMSEAEKTIRRAIDAGELDEEIAEAVRFFVSDGMDELDARFWARAEAVHDALPYGTNCSECGLEHPRLWDEPPITPADLVEEWRAWRDANIPGGE
jgi:bacterioferritin-associated ferredoxin